MKIKLFLCALFMPFIFDVYSQNSTFDIADPNTGNLIIENSKSVFTCNKKEYSTSSIPLLYKNNFPVKTTFGDGQCESYQYRSDDNILFGIEIVKYENNSWITINGWVKNLSDKIITFDKVNLLDVAEGPKFKGDILQTRALCGSTDRLTWFYDVLKNEDKHLSARSFLGLYNSDSKEEYTLGFSIRQAWGSFLYDFSNKEPHFSAIVNMDVDLEPGELRYAEALHIKKGNVWKDIKNLINVTGKEVNAITNGKSFGGWCSWYGFNPFIDNDITEDVVINFASQASKIKDLPFELMLLDDGYFTLPGDWTTLRPFFPNGMKYLTDECKKNNLIPGVWIAATLVHENSKIFKDKNEWVDKNKDGSYHHNQFNWGGKTHSFDATNKDFLHHIDTLFRHIAKDWGFKYLKLDFNIEPSSNRQNRKITSFQAIRNFYKVIENAVGDSVFIANCAGSPYSPVIGIAKAGRVGPDVNPNWKSVIEGCRSSILHIPFHRRWWVNDPDCLNMRENRSSLSEQELQAHVTANFMGGGYVLFSDSLNELTAKRHRMLALALPTAGNAAEIADYMTAPNIGIPSLMYYPVDSVIKGSSIVSLFNWDNTVQNRKINLTEVGLKSGVEYHVYDFWNDSYRGIIKDFITVEKQKPHSCNVFAIRPVMKNEIQVISTNLHLLQGTKEIKKITRINTSPFNKAKAEIWIEMSPVSLREGKLILAANDNLHVAAVQGAKANLHKREDGLWDLNVSDMKDNVAILLRVR